MIISLIYMICIFYPATPFTLVTTSSMKLIRTASWVISKLIQFTFVISVHHRTNYCRMLLLSVFLQWIMICKNPDTCKVLFFQLSPESEASPGLRCMRQSGVGAWDHGSQAAPLPWSPHCAQGSGVWV